MLIAYYLSINIDYIVYYYNLKNNNDNIESAKITWLTFVNDFVSVIQGVQLKTSC